MAGCFWNRFQFGCVFQDNKSRVCRTRASLHGRCEHNREKRGPRSAVRNIISIQEDGCDKGAHQSYLGTERNTCHSKLSSTRWPEASPIPTTKLKQPALHWAQVVSVMAGLTSDLDWPALAAFWNAFFFLLVEQAMQAVFSWFWSSGEQWSKFSVRWS